MSDSHGVAAVILAAGQGKRMKSDLPKVMHEVGGKPMVQHVIGQAKGIDADPVVVIVGHGRELVISVVEEAGATWAVQEDQLGTGHAVQMAEEALEGFTGDILVLSGDVPLLSVETLSRVLAYHRQKAAAATVITANAPDPAGYGRVLRGEDGNVYAIREHKDCSEDELAIDEINSGIYLFRKTELFDALRNVTNDNAQGEYYLPDVFARYFREGKPVAAIAAGFEEIHGINNREDLAEANRIYEENAVGT